MAFGARIHCYTVFIANLDFFLLLVYKCDFGIHIVEMENVSSIVYTKQYRYTKDTANPII